MIRDIKKREDLRRQMLTFKSRIGMHYDKPKVTIELEGKLFMKSSLEVQRFHDFNSVKQAKYNDFDPDRRFWDSDEDEDYLQAAGGWLPKPMLDSVFKLNQPIQLRFEKVTKTQNRLILQKAGGLDSELQRILFKLFLIRQAIFICRGLCDANANVAGKINRTRTDMANISTTAISLAEGRNDLSNHEFLHNDPMVSDVTALSEIGSNIVEQLRLFLQSLQIQERHSRVRMFDTFEHLKDAFELFINGDALEEMIRLRFKKDWDEAQNVQDREKYTHGLKTCKKSIQHYYEMFKCRFMQFGIFTGLEGNEIKMELSWAFARVQAVMCTAERYAPGFTYLDNFPRQITEKYFGHQVVSDDEDC